MEVEGAVLMSVTSERAVTSEGAEGAVETVSVGTVETASVGTVEEELSEVIGELDGGWRGARADSEGGEGSFEARSLE